MRHAEILPRGINPPDVEEWQEVVFQHLTHHEKFHLEKRLADLPSSVIKHGLLKDTLRIFR